MYIDNDSLSIIKSETLGVQGQIVNFPMECKGYKCPVNEYIKLEYKVTNKRDVQVSVFARIHAVHAHQDQDDFVIYNGVSQFLLHIEAYSSRTVLFECAITFASRVQFACQLEEISGAGERLISKSKYEEPVFVVGSIDLIHWASVIDVNVY